MVCCVCINCNSHDMILSGDLKYLICNNCGNRDYIRDLEIGLIEVKEKNNGKEF